ncbi:MAG: hypothetical protein AAF517_12920 [Planctomycetota bacterium]
MLRGRFFLVLLSFGPTLSVRAEESSGALKSRLRSSGESLIYETYIESNWEIVLAGADGGKPRNLTKTPRVHELYPQSSPDGKQIAFVADEELKGKKVRSVYVMSSNGGNRRLVARNARQPAWTYDGKTLLYLPGEFDAYTVKDFATKGLVFYDTTTGKSRPHPNPKLHHLYNPTCSRDGRWILATVHGGMGYGHAILAIDAAGTGVHDLKIKGCRPTLSNDGKKICWGEDDHTIVVGNFVVKDGVPRVVAKKALIREKELHVYHSDWSASGEFIVFSRGPGGRVSPSGPGTNRGLAEFVGVRAPWRLCILPVSGNGPLVEVTDGECAKEADWVVSPKSKGGRS